MRPSIIRVAMLVTMLIGGIAFAEEPDRWGAINRDKDGHRVWAVEPYLVGTAAQIRDVVNGDVERLAAKKASLIERRDRQREFTANTLRTIISNTHETKEYKDLAAELLSDTNELAAARRQDDTQMALEASSKCNLQREKMMKMESNAVHASSIYARAVKDLRDREKEVGVVDEPIKKAKAWRQKIVSAVMHSFKLSAPIEADGQGLLGTVKVKKIVSGTSAQVVFMAEMLEATKPSKDADGIYTSTYNIVPIPLMVNGIDTAGMVEGKEVMIDKSFQVKGKTIVDGETAVVVERSPKGNDIDELIAAVNDLRNAPTTQPKQ